MWSSSRRAFALLLCLAPLGACGFEPLYAERPGAVTAALKEIRVDPIPDRIGQKLRTELQRRFNPLNEPAAADYRLTVAISEDVLGTASREDNTVTRVNLTLFGRYILRRIDGDTEVARGTVRSTNSYNVLASDFATLVAEDDARDRAVREIATAIQTRLALRLREMAPEG